MSSLNSMAVCPNGNNIVVSPGGIIHVLGYTPTEGEAGAPISVRIHFHPDYAETIYVRLVIGHKAVATTVRELKDIVYGRWQLDAVAPPFDHNQSSSTKVLISVQALNDENAILDTATFGEFSYWAPGRSVPSSAPSFSSRRRATVASGSPSTETTPSQGKKPTLHINTLGAGAHSLRRRGASHLPTPSPTSPERPNIQLANALPSSRTEVHLHRRTKADSLVRPRHGKALSDIHAQTPILDLVSNLQAICQGWTPAEVAVGRRLVRFSKVQDGRRLIVSCVPIKAEEYRDSDSVISCIYREESDSWFVTSVDIIFLLERLTSSDFPVEEKNRIRRNLEGLRPTTVSKHKQGFEEFFQRIMEFPDPKPRNIEKDLKVFEWSLLDQALDKILSKYTIDASSSTLPAEPESAEPSPPSSSDDDYQLSYPIKLEDSPSSSSYPNLPGLQPKYEGFPDNLRFLPSSDGSDSYCSPVDATGAGLPTTYQLYTADLPAAPHASGSSPDGWGPEYKPGIMGGAEEIIESYGYVSGAIGEYAPTMEYPYEGLAFQSIPGELALVEPYL